MNISLDVEKFFFAFDSHYCWPNTECTVIQMYHFPTLPLPGIAAATMFMPETENELSESQLKVAFDGDAVLFSDESEVIVKQHGLDTFFEHEKEFENKPLAQVEHLAEARCKNGVKNKCLFFPICPAGVIHPPAEGCIFPCRNVPPLSVIEESLMY